MITYDSIGCQSSEQHSNSGEVEIWRNLKSEIHIQIWHTKVDFFALNKLWPKFGSQDTHKE